ncbi:hypothetical protein GCM10009760_17810 [Kitasatospora kazusensis]|uniref:Peptidase C14 caspase domain-containing protein n=1 Tax=Kitasatospora kazusensis TaxID=407974 RepID=A0ABN2Z688_9ACTN
MPELPAENRSALVIATGVYADAQLARLRSPARDAADLAKVLGDPRLGRFEVTSLLDRSAHEIRMGVEDFLSGRATGDLLVVYLSCHGVRDARGRLYFAAADTDKAHLSSTGIESLWLLERLDECRARRQVLILDCCFSGAFAATGRKGEGEGELWRLLVGHGRGRVVLTASRAGEYSYEGQALPGAEITGSVFTTGLVNGLRTGGADSDNDGLISVEDAYDYAYTHVQAHAAAQTPQRWAYGAEGKIWLAHNPYASPTGQPQPASPGPPVGNVSAKPSTANHGRDPHTLGTDGPDRLFPQKEFREAVQRSRIRRRTVLLGGLAAAVGVPSIVLLSRRDHPSLNPAQKSGLPSLSATLNAAAPVGKVAFSPDGKLLAAGISDTATTQLWDLTAKSAPVNLTAEGAAVMDIAFNPSNANMLVVCGLDGRIRLWDVSNRTVSVTIAPPLYHQTVNNLVIEAVAFSRDGKLVAGGDNVGRAWLWNTTTGETTTLEVPTIYMNANSLSFSPDGKTLAAGLEPVGGTQDGVRLWDVGTGRLAASIPGPAWVHSVAFSPDGLTLATGSENGGAIELWEVATRKSIAALAGHTGPVNSVAFSPDGKTIASGGIDKTVRLWEVATRENVATLTNHTDPVNSVAFSPDGKTIASGGSDKTVRLWKVS